MNSNEILHRASWILLFGASAIAIRGLPPDYYRQSLFNVLGLGIFFDALSLFYYVASLIQRKYMSGFPGVSLIPYLWFAIASNFSLVAPHETQVYRIILLKFVDAAILFGFSGLCHFPARFARSMGRSQDED